MHGVWSVLGLGKIHTKFTDECGAYCLVYPDLVYREEENWAYSHCAMMMLMLASELYSLGFFIIIPHPLSCNIGNPRI